MPRNLEVYDRQVGDPVWWLGSVFKEVYWCKQIEIIESVRDNPRTAVKSCHSGGKTHVAAGIVCWFLNSFSDSIVLTTAPTWRQVNKLLWGEIRTLYPKARTHVFGKPMKTPMLRIKDNWYAFGLSTDDPDRFQGFHARRILVVVDEASGVPDSIFEAIRGIMASGEVRLLLLGNPTRPQGEFYDAFNSKRAFYNCITIDALDTPNLAPLKAEYESLETKAEKMALLRAAPIVVPYLISSSWVADILEEFGEESSFWQSRVRGNFPSESPDQLIPLHWIEAAEIRWENLNREQRWWERAERDHPVELGVDVARYGDCETVLVARCGEIAAPLDCRRKQDTMETAGVIVSRRREIGAERIRIDIPGMGAGPYDRLKEQGVPGIEEYNGGNRARNAERFADKRSEDYWGLRKRYEEGSIAHPPDKKLAGQLSGLRYKTNSKGQIMLESKEDMRKRNVASPDRADALCIAFAAPARQKSGAFFL